MDFKKTKVIIVDVLIGLVLFFPTIEIFAPSLSLWFGKNSYTKVCIINFFLVCIHSATLFYLLYWEYKQGGDSLAQKIVTKTQKSRLVWILFLQNNHDRKTILNDMLVITTAIVFLRYAVFVVATSKKYIRGIVDLLVGTFLKTTIYVAFGQTISQIIRFIF